MTLREALHSAGFQVEPRSATETYAECCGEPVSWEAWAGGIFGPSRVWCDICGGEVRQRRNVDEYGVEQTARPDREAG